MQQSRCYRSRWGAATARGILQVLAGPFPREWDDAQVPPGGHPTNCKALKARWSEHGVAVHLDGQHHLLGKEKNQSGAGEPKCLS